MIPDSTEAMLRLVEQHRVGQLEIELQRLLERDGSDAPTRSLLALCLAERERWDEATREAERATLDEPESSYCRWALASILADRNLLARARAEAERGLALDPTHPDLLTLLARCHLGLGDRAAALEAAEKVLESEPDDTACANIRAYALHRLGRRVEADQAFVDAGSADPGNAFARAGRGWAALRTSPDTALLHFHQALAIDPGSEWAREGFITALKAKNPLYRVMLRYFLWMDALSPRARWFVLLGGVFGYGWLRRLAGALPELAPFIWPLLGLYVLFLILSWTAEPIFDFLLRLDPQGRRILTRERITASTWVVGVVGWALCLGVAALITGSERLIGGALVFGFLVIPVSGIFQCEPGWPRQVMSAIALGVAVLGAGTLFAPPEIGTTFMLMGMLGAALSSWVNRWLAGISPVR